MRKIIISILSISIFLTSCVRGTIINSSPTGAKVYINGELEGETPYKYEDNKISWSKVNITLKKDGYKDLKEVITRDEKLDIVPLIGGFILFVPFLWTMKYKDSRTYNLVSNSDNSNVKTDIIKKKVDLKEKKNIKSSTNSDYPVMLRVQGKIKVSDDFRDGVEEILTTYNYSLVDEKAQTEALKNQSEQRNSECYDDSCLVDTGKMLAAKALIIVKIDKKGENSYKFKARFIDFERGTTRKSVAKYYEFSLSNYKELMNFGKLLTTSLLKE